MLTDRDKEYMQSFYEAILTLKTPEECAAFFDDVCTIKELLDMSARLHVAKLLDNGMIFNDISKETGASSATISRVNKCLRFGPGGYKIVLERLSKDE